MWQHAAGATGMVNRVARWTLIVSLLSLLVLGFLLGVRHATDPDHLIAVTAIVSRERSLRSAVSIGALWGLGHSITVSLVGGAIVLFRWVVPPRLGLSLEMGVAGMLILLGFYNLARADAHEHPGHAPSPTPVELGWRRFVSARLLRPLAVGVVHGLAGSAAIALLVLTTVHSARRAGIYLAVFGMGTIAGMVTLTLAIAAPALLASRWVTRARSPLVRATGCLSIVFGLVLAYRIGVVGGLFTSHPVWSPE